MKNGNSVLKNAEWKNFDLIYDEIDVKTDAVICSYVINEIEKNARENAINKLYEATNNLLIIIEPGTPAGFEHILEIRKKLLDKGMHIVAPCTHENECSLPKDDWCNCMVRVNREKIHKELKGGVSPFEDEKFSYIVFSKENVVLPEKRILRHPNVNSGFINFKICTSSGIEKATVSKKYGDYYKRARKLDIGDILE
jgi:ribosomal protein RSM22 (predicted rRNA methylase)